jgi:hypothetical protein
LPVVPATASQRSPWNAVKTIVVFIGRSGGYLGSNTAAIAPGRVTVRKGKSPRMLQRKKVSDASD